MSAEIVRHAATLMRERETEPWRLAVADWLDDVSEWVDSAAVESAEQMRATTVARAYLEEGE